MSGAIDAGPQPITVTIANGTSAHVNVTVNAVQPGLVRCSDALSRCATECHVDPPASPDHIRLTAICETGRATLESARSRMPSASSGVWYRLSIAEQVGSARSSFEPVDELVGKYRTVELASKLRDTGSHLLECRTVIGCFLQHIRKHFRIIRSDSESTLIII